MRRPDLSRTFLDSSFMRMGLLVLLTTGSLGCTHPRLTDLYLEASPAHQEMLLAHFDLLTEDRAVELLTHPGDPRTLLENWRLGESDRRSRPSDFRPTEMEVQTPHQMPVKDGRRLQLFARIKSPSQKLWVDVTPNTRWSTQPQSAWISDAGQLDYECLHQDQRVDADWLGVLRTSFVIPFKKDIRSLDLIVDESSQVIQRSDHLRLRVTSRCEDGTWSDVTCQTDWNYDKSIGRMASCGDFQILDSAVIESGALQIEAQYGGLQTQRTLRFKVR